MYTSIMANQHISRHDVVKRGLKSASVRSPSSLQCSPNMLAQKTPGSEIGLYFEGTEPTFSVLDPFRRCWQIKQAMPNHYYGILWYVVYLKFGGAMTRQA